MGSSSGDRDPKQMNRNLFQSRLYIIQIFLPKHPAPVLQWISLTSHSPYWKISEIILSRKKTNGDKSPAMLTLLSWTSNFFQHQMIVWALCGLRLYIFHIIAKPYGKCAAVHRNPSYSSLFTTGKQIRPGYLQEADSCCPANSPRSSAETERWGMRHEPSHSVILTYAVVSSWFEGCEMQVVV